MMGDYQEWIGRTRIERDVVTLAHARGLAALLDRDPDGFEPGTPLPECWHWIYFNPVVRRSEQGPDGHARRGSGGFLPPIEYPRRMWAGGRLEFAQPLAVGDAIERRSEIAAIEEKSGRTGNFV